VLKLWPSNSSGISSGHLLKTRAGKDEELEGSIRSGGEEIKAARNPVSQQVDAQATGFGRELKFVQTTLGSEC
jgi:hypothetical protein